MAGFNRTLSPQGDGNVISLNHVSSSHFLVGSTEPFPRKGTETRCSAIALHSPLVRFNRTLSPQGDGNCKSQCAIKAEVSPVQQNPFPARGRKRTLLVRATPLTTTTFNRTLSPQGDGNPSDTRVRFNRTLSPQGDGNLRVG